MAAILTLHPRFFARIPITLNSEYLHTTKDEIRVKHNGALYTILGPRTQIFRVFYTNKMRTKTLINRDTRDS